MIWNAPLHSVCPRPPETLPAPRKRSQSVTQLSTVLLVKGEKSLEQIIQIDMVLRCLRHDFFVQAVNTKQPKKQETQFRM